MEVCPPWQFKRRGMGACIDCTIRWLYLLLLFKFLFFLLIKPTIVSSHHIVNIFLGHQYDLMHADLLLLIIFPIFKQILFMNLVWEHWLYVIPMSTFTNFSLPFPMHDLLILIFTYVCTNVCLTQKVHLPHICMVCPTLIDIVSLQPSNLSLRDKTRKKGRKIEKDRDPRYWFESHGYHLENSTYELLTVCFPEQEQHNDSTSLHTSTQMGNSTWSLPQMKSYRRSMSDERGRNSYESLQICCM